MRFLRSLFRSSRGWYNYSGLLILTVILIAFYIIQMTYLNSFVRMRHAGKKETEKKLEREFSFFPNFKFEGQQLVHFDFKGAPPKISYLVDIIPFIKKLGASGILLEYEDMFPYQGGLKEISAMNAYTPSDVATIVKTAQANNMTIIPLVPTFGQLEFVLKLPKFQNFREVEAYPNVLCPSQSKVYPVLYKMIDQILAAHPTTKYIHIGSDETNIVGMCKKCQYLMRKYKWGKDDIYFNHVRKLSQYIAKTYPDVRPIIWGDKFFKQNERSIQMHRIHDAVDIMLFNHHPEKHTFPSEVDMSSYARLFKNVWIAGAFKGTPEKMTLIPNPDYYFRNTKAWMYFVSGWKNKINFKGIVLTGWQRYSHFSPLREFFPVGIPSLALSLQYLNKKKGSDHEKVKNALSCNQFVPLNLRRIRDLELLTKLKCDYPGYRIYQIIHIFYNVRKNLKILLRELDPAEMSFYRIMQNTSNPFIVHKLSLRSYKNYLIKVNEIENNTRAALSEVYDQHAINEWILTYVLPLRFQLEAAIKVITALKNRKEWPRRPFPDVIPRVKQYFNKTCGETETQGCTLFYIL